ncbi:MAG: DUF2589 domain-containing protein [Crocinitomicaceae bacterium]|nr:DUF2589 domain-containing protein [Crocinitomicaceae bacterium]
MSKLKENTMISFKKFVDEIHDAIQEANESLMGKSDGLLNNYFARSDEVETILANLDNAIEASDNVTNKGVAATTEDIKRASDALQKASDALRGLSTKTVDELQDFGNLSPKVVTVECPYIDKNGKSAKTEIQVPLLTLVPLSHIEKAALKADFDIEVVNDTVQLNFTNREKSQIPH